MDVFLAERLELTRARVARLIEDGMVLVDGKPPRKSDGVRRGQEIHVRIPAPEPAEAVPEAIPLEIVYEDADLVVVDKPAGMVVHPSKGHPAGTLVNALLHHVDDLSGIGGTLRPGIVHRLDRDTSGLLVVAKNDASHHGLSDALRRREVVRRYLAAAWGHLPDDEMTVDAPIGRHPRDRVRMAVVESGRNAVTELRVRENWVAAQLLDVSLRTGRTHQIRVHLAHIGHPVVGDAVYGQGRERGMSGPGRAWAREFARRVDRQFLHAAVLAFAHPRTGEPMRFESPLPGDLARAAEWARGGAE